MKTLERLDQKLLAQRPGLVLDWPGWEDGARDMIRLLCEEIDELSERIKRFEEVDAKKLGIGGM